MNQVTEVLKTKMGEVWEEGDGFIYTDLYTTIYSFEEMRDHYGKYQEKYGTEKRLHLVTFQELPLRTPMPDVREYNNGQLHMVTKAFAVVTSSAMIRMFVNMYIRLSSIRFPVKLFATHEEAKDWLKSHEEVDEHIVAFKG